MSEFKQTSEVFKTTEVCGFYINILTGFPRNPAILNTGTNCGLTPSRQDKNFSSLAPPARAGVVTCAFALKSKHQKTAINDRAAYSACTLRAGRLTLKGTMSAPSLMRWPTERVAFMPCVLFDPIFQRLQYPLSFRLLFYFF